MIAVVKNHWHYEDAYTFVNSNVRLERIFDEEYPPDEADGENPELFDRVMRHASSEGDQSVIEAILAKVDGKFFVTFHQEHPNDDGVYTVYEFE